LGLKQESSSTDVLDVKPDSASTPSAGEVASARDRFPCPSCGSMLREGAILCPHCQTDFRKPYASPEPSAETAMHPIWGPPLRATTPADRRLALVSVIMASIALLANVGLYVMARRAPQLLLLVAILDLGKLLLAILAIRLARQAVRRIDNTRDKRGVMMAQVGLMLGWATIGYAVISLVIWPFTQVTSNIHP
jgi:hypothetical protein